MNKLSNRLGKSHNLGNKNITLYLMCKKCGTNQKSIPTEFPKKYYKYRTFDYPIKSNELKNARIVSNTEYIYTSIEHIYNCSACSEEIVVSFFKIKK